MTETARKRPARPSKRQLNIRITPESLTILQAVLDRDGVLFGAQVERALRLWADHKGIEVPDGKHKSGAAR
jgi:hypothetical protein